MRATRLLVLGLAALACAIASGCSSTKHAAETAPRPDLAPRQTAKAKPTPIGVVERTVGSLARPLQDAAAARSGTGALLLGGLDAADTSVSDVRFVSATHRDLSAEVKAGRFRADLYFRLNGITLVVPPLRERREEVHDLARSFARDACRGAGLPEAEMPAFAEVVRSVRDEHEAGVLLIDHDMALIMDVCDRIQVLDQGRTLAEGSPSEIRANIDVAAAYLGESAVVE